MNMIIVTAIILITIGQALGGWCPTPDKIAPCTCDGSMVRCYTNDELDLDTIFREIQGTFHPGDNQFETFELSSSEIDKIYNNDLHGVVFREIRLKSCPKLTCLEPQAFSYMDRFTLRFTAEGANLSDTTSNCNVFNILSTMNALQIVTILGSGLKAIPDYAFSSRTGQQVDLRTINLGGATKGFIETIGKNAFSELRNLNKLDLSSNNIGIVAVNAFSFTEQSTDQLTINLEHNNINRSTFQYPAFDVNGRVTLLKLNGNHKIELLPEGVFRTFLMNKPYGLNKIELNGSPLYVDTDNAWLIENKAELDLSDKLINALTPDGNNILMELKRHFSNTPPKTGPQLEPTQPSF